MDIKLCPGDALLRGVRGHEALHVCLHGGAAGGAGAGLGRGDPGGGPRPGGHQHGQEPHPHLQGEGHTITRRECCCLIIIPQIEAPPPAWLVAGSLRSLGWTDRTAGWWFHSLHRLLSSLLPLWFLSRFLGLFGYYQYRYSASKKKEN